MKKIIGVFLIILFYSANAQGENDVSIFHRLLLFNSHNEMMIVKIENTDFWVTPGFYQTKVQTIKSGLDSIASTYGLALNGHKLKGSFILKRELKGNLSTSLRNIYTAKVKGGTPKKPYGIAEIKWLSPANAIQIITFPHINLMIQQIIEQPDKVWGGTLLQYKEEDLWKIKILEEFYTL